MLSERKRNPFLATSSRSFTWSCSVRLCQAVTKPCARTSRGNTGTAKPAPDAAKNLRRDHVIVCPHHHCWRIADAENQNQSAVAMLLMNRLHDPDRHRFLRIDLCPPAAPGCQLIEAKTSVRLRF